MADGGVAANAANNTDGRALNSPVLSKPFSMEDAHALHGRLLGILSLAQVVQSAATGDMDLPESGIYGTAAVMEREAEEAIRLLGL
jgi:hypothetical protein